jgi:Asp-tRNA(Asn)/Glu-tRNA(Gln) amidotransferase A subunit family amidase
MPAVEELLSKSVTELRALIASRAISSTELVQVFLRRIDDFNPSLNAIVTVASDVLDQARQCDAKFAAGSATGPLHGVPLTIKDTIATKGIRTTIGSPLFANNVPRQDAAVVTRLKTAGAIILGKTNTPEMAIPYETDNPVFGRTNNPGDSSRTPGGSSGGEAAAIAAKLSPAGVGSDLAGSIRVPAHFCGIAGLKPTTGSVSMDGHVPHAAGPLSMGACIGPMARSVADLALLFGVMSNQPEAKSNESLSMLEGERVAWYTDDGVAPVTAEVANAVRSAAKFLADAGFDVREELAPSMSEASRLWVELFSQAASEQIRSHYRGREHDAGPLVSALFRSHQPQTTFEEKIRTAETLAKAVVERERRREDLLRWMNETSLIVAPVSATAAFAHGAMRVEVNGESISVFRSCSYAQAANVFGLPAAVVPVARSKEGLPIGVQVIGRPSDDRAVLTAAAIIEQSAGYW